MLHLILLQSPNFQTESLPIVAALAKFALDDIPVREQRCAISVSNLFVLKSFALPLSVMADCKSLLVVAANTNRRCLLTFCAKP
jgi:hypothetical protein